MKKTIPFFIIMLLTTACDPYLGDGHIGEWHIKNSTDQTLVINMLEFDVASWNVAHGNSVEIIYYKFSRVDYKKPYFNGWLEGSDFTKEASLEVLSEDGVLLKKWNYTDKDSPGKQFFNENSWDYYEEIEKGGSVRVVWVFEILPEDIVPEPEP